MLKWITSATTSNPNFIQQLFPVQVQSLWMTFPVTTLHNLTYIYSTIEGLEAAKALMLWAFATNRAFLYLSTCLLASKYSL